MTMPAVRTAATGLQPIPALQNCLAARPGSDTVAFLASGHQAVLLLLRSASDTTSKSSHSDADASTTGSSNNSGTLAASAVLRLGFGAGNAACCAAWDATGEWLAVGTTQQLHLFRCGRDGDEAVPVGSTQLRFTPKVQRITIRLFSADPTGTWSTSCCIDSWRKGCPIREPLRAWPELLGIASLQDVAVSWHPQNSSVTLAVGGAIGLAVFEATREVRPSHMLPKPHDNNTTRHSCACATNELYQPHIVEPCTLLRTGAFSCGRNLAQPLPRTGACAASAPWRAGCQFVQSPLAAAV